MSTWLGIDIGTTAVKVAAVRTAYRKVQLVGLASVEVAQAGGVAEAISQADARGRWASEAGLGDAHRDLARRTARHRQGRSACPHRAQRSRSPRSSRSSSSRRSRSTSRRRSSTTACSPALRDKKGEELAVLVGVAKTADVAARIELVKGALAAEPERVGIGAFPIANLLAVRADARRGRRRGRRSRHGLERRPHPEERRAALRAHRRARHEGPPRHRREARARAPHDDRRASRAGRRAADARCFCAAAAPTSPARRRSSRARSSSPSRCSPRPRSR